MTAIRLLATRIGQTVRRPHPKQEVARREIERERGPDQHRGEESGRVRVKRKTSYPSSNLSNERWPTIVHIGVVLEISHDNKKLAVSQCKGLIKVRG
jgi:hypothetical protein